MQSSVPELSLPSFGWWKVVDKFPCIFQKPEPDLETKEAGSSKSDATSTANTELMDSDAMLVGEDRIEVAIEESLKRASNTAPKSFFGPI